MTALDLARRLVAAPQWEWRPGMRDDSGNRLVRFDAAGSGELGFHVYSTDRIAYSWPVHMTEARVVPDLTDPATAGILLAMLAELEDVDVQAHSCPLGWGGYAWRVVTNTYAGDQTGGYLEREHQAPTLGEAVAMALLEVWGG